MKISELTDEQLLVIAEHRPDWIAKNRYVWAMDYLPQLMYQHDPYRLAGRRPDWVAKHYPEWMGCHCPQDMADYRPEWMAKNRPSWKINRHPREQDVKPRDVQHFVIVPGDKKVPADIEALLSNSS